MNWPGSLCSSTLRRWTAIALALQHSMHIDDYLPPFVGAELCGIGRHFPCPHGDHVKYSSRGKLHQPVRNVRRRRRNLSGDWTIASALLAVADSAIRVKKFFA